MTVQVPNVASQQHCANESKMYTNQQSGIFHDYASPPQQMAIPEHSLHTDLRAYASSPNSLSIYEHDFNDLPSSLPSSCGSAFDVGDLADCDLKPELECSDDLLGMSLSTLGIPFDEMNRGDPVWSPLEPTSMKMEDILQIDKTDGLQGPTLAQLNFTDSFSQFDDLENMVIDKKAGQVMWSQGSNLTAPLAPSTVLNCNNIKNPVSLPKTTCTLTTATLASSLNSPQSHHTPGLSETNNNSIGNIALAPDKFSIVPKAKIPVVMTNTNGQQIKSEVKKSCDLLPQFLQTDSSMTQQGMMQLAPASLPATQQVTNRVQSPNGSSCDSNGSMDRKWEEIRQFIYDEPPKFVSNENGANKAIVKSEPIDVAYTPKDDVNTADEDTDLEEGDVERMEQDDDNDDDMLSETESVDSILSFPEELSPSGTKKDKRFFWQYNTQSKGPKGKRLCKAVPTDNPYKLQNFEDPVFDPDLNQSRYKHNGKARKGDGNDVNPSPYKLYQIGNELKKLNKIINDLMPVGELPVNSRTKSRREKNKLASRACRLKKKAQHEANKLKLFGLDREHENLMTVLTVMKKEMNDQVRNPEAKLAGKLTDKLDRLIKVHLKHMIAGHTTDYVNSVVLKTAAGDPTGGIYK